MNCEHPPACPITCHSHCQAFDRITKTLCSALPSSGSKWCTLHEELQAKLLKTYKRSSLAVEAFDDSLLPSESDLVVVKDLSKLKEFSDNTRMKWSLTFRASLARSSHHDQFYQGGDESHCFFVDSLKEESIRLENLLRALDKRAYSIVLANSEAEWILAPSTSTSFICNDSPTTKRTNALLTPPTTPPLLPKQLPLTSTTQTSTIRNQRKKATRKNRKLVGEEDEEDTCCPGSSSPCIETPDTAELLSRLRSYLIPPSSLPNNIQPSTWHTTVAHLFRHVILRIPSLALLAFDSVGGIQTFSSVEAFLDFLQERSCCVVEVERLYTGMNFAKSWNEEGEGIGSRFLGVGILRDAIAEVYRVEENQYTTTRKFVELLGGKVFKETNEEELSNEGWDLFYQFVGCFGCSLSVTRNFTAHTRNRRLALQGSYPDWFDRNESKTDNVFREAGIIRLSHNVSTSGKKIKRVVQKVSKGKAVLVETWERPWSFFNMQLGIASMKILEKLIALPSRFEILAKNLSTGEEFSTLATSNSSCNVKNCNCCSPNDLWLSKVRSGTNPTSRKESNWSVSTFFPCSTTLDSLQKSSATEARFDRQFSDLIAVLVLDNQSYAGSNEFSTFINRITAIVVEEKVELINRGEILISLLEHGCEEKVTRNMFRN